MTALDGYPMAQQGRGGVALYFRRQLVLWLPDRHWRHHPLRPGVGPVVAGVWSGRVFCPDGVRHRLSRQHDGAESAEVVLSALIGLSLATVGVDANTGVYRFTFDSVHLSDGVQFIVVVIGLFSVSEILLMLEHTSSGRRWCVKPDVCSLMPKRGAVCGCHPAFVGDRFLRRHFARRRATIASAITYMTEKS